MASTVTSSIRWLAQQMDNGIADLPSAVNSGIIGDEAHNRSGYHFGAAEQRDSNNYSVTRFDDRRPQRTNDHAATAVDTSKNRADMVRSWGRVYRVWLNRASDPRAKYLNAYNGWNGTGSAERLDFVTGARTVTDSSHTWHDHTEVRRRYADDMTAMRAIISILRGETVEQWNAGNGGDGDDVNELQDKRLASAEFRLHHLFQLDNTVEGDPFGGTYDLKLVTKLVELFDDVAELKRDLADLKARPAATVQMTPADHAAIADLIAQRLGTLRFTDADGPDQA